MQGAPKRVGRIVSFGLLLSICFFFFSFFFCFYLSIYLSGRFGSRALGWYKDKNTEVWLAG